VQMQAQSDNLEATARKNINVTSSDQKIDLAAAKEILLVSGGAYVRIKDGNIELHAPGKVEVKGAMKSFGGPTEMHFGKPVLPDGDDPICVSCWLKALKEQRALVKVQQ